MGKQSDGWLWFPNGRLWLQTRLCSSAVFPGGSGLPTNGKLSATCHVCHSIHALSRSICTPADVSGSSPTQSGANGLQTAISEVSSGPRRATSPPDACCPRNPNHPLSTVNHPPADAAGSSPPIESRSGGRSPPATSEISSAHTPGTASRGAQSAGDGCSRGNFCPACRVGDIKPTEVAAAANSHTGIASGRRRSCAASRSRRNWPWRIRWVSRCPGSEGAVGLLASGSMPNT